MNYGNLMLKQINLLASKANELINKNKVLQRELSYYQQLFNSNKNNITTYFNILAENKKKNKSKKNNNIINDIKNIIIKHHSEIKEKCSASKQNIKNIEQKNNMYLLKLISETKEITELYDKISEDNFLYVNAVMSKENYIKCLKKELANIKSKLFEDQKYIYLKYNFQNVYKQQTNQTQANDNNKNDNFSFEEGENEIKDLLTRERQQFIIRMKLRNEIRLNYRKMNVKKKALNDLVTSISFINKTEIIPSKRNNIFEVLNKKIGGIVKNYEKYFNEDEDIDENYFIFLPFELEVNKDEMNELVQTDITLPNKKLETKSINEYKKIDKKHTRNKSFINVPKLNFLQIEFNKEKISYSDNESEKNDEKNKDNKNTQNNQNNQKDNNNNNINNKNNNDKEKNKANKSKNAKENIYLKIKQLKKDIKFYKRKNIKMKRIIKDFENFQNKIKDKFIIFEKMMKIEKEKKEIFLNKNNI